jgi:hypothetical protein
MNDDDLDPEVVAALREIAPASDALRDKHIAAALAASAPASSRSRVKWLSAAAAVIVLLVGGNALYAALSPSGETPTIAATPNNSATTLVPVKGSACSASLTDYTIVGTYLSAGSVREVWSSKQDLVVVDQTSCAQLGTFTHPDVVANDKVCEGFFSSFAPEGVQVGAYSVAGSELVLVATPTELQICDGSCAVIASYPLPTGP